MYVVRLVNNTNAARQHVPTGGTRYFPAENCQWAQIEQANGGYSISEVIFYDPTQSSAVALSAGSEESATEQTIVTLGYIGKSGRFVPITVEHHENGTGS